MTFRLKAAIEEMRQQHSASEKELEAARLVAVDARRVAVGMAGALLAGQAAKKQNTALYASQLRERRRQMARRHEAARSYGKGAPNRVSSDEDSVREAKYKRILVVDRMKSLVLTKEGDNEYVLEKNRKFKIPKNRH